MTYSTPIKTPMISRNAKPSPTPLAYERAAREKLPGVFRDGKLLVVRKGADISHVCLRCGRPTNGHRITKRLHSNFAGGSGTGSTGSTGTAFDAIILIFYLIMLIVWIAVAIADFAESRKRTVTYGLCESHRNLRSTLGWSAFASLLGGIFACILGGVFIHHLPFGGSPAVGVTTIIAGALLLIVAAICAGKMPGVSLDRQGGGELWLKGAGKNVLDAQTPLVGEEVIGKTKPAIAKR